MSDDESGREFALEVVRRLQQAGYQALWAGGCVRDLILGQTPAGLRRGDRRDSRTGHGGLAVPRGHRRDLVRRRAGAESASAGRSRSRSRRSAAMVPMSTAGGPNRSSSARPSSTPPAAISRSTACFLTRSPTQLIDYVGGHADLKNHVLRAIGDPEARLREDKLRVLRAIRLAARFQFRSSRPLWPRSNRWPARSSRVSKERIAQELRKMLVHREPGPGHGAGSGHGPGRGDPARSAADERACFRASRCSPRATCGTTRCWCSSSCPPIPALRSPSRRSCTMSASLSTRTLQQGRYRFHHHEQSRCPDQRPAVPRPETLERRTRANHLARRFSSVPGRGQEAPRVEAQADPGGAGHRRAAGASSRRCAGVDGQYRACRLLPDTI